MRLTLYTHGGSKNHGCEAIVRGTKSVVEADIILFSNQPDEDISYGLDKILSLRHFQPRISLLEYINGFLSYHLKKQSDAFDRVAFKKFYKACANSDYVLSVGGDNYCYSVPSYIFSLNDEIRRLGNKHILWGCSVEPDYITKQVLEDLKGYTRIIARESFTYNALRSNGLENTCLYPDPAFLLHCKSTSLPTGFLSGNTVGVNVSPLIISREAFGGSTMDNFVRLIEYIIHNTDMQVAFIPHVVWTDNDDRVPLSLLFDRFKNTGRVTMIDDRPAEELKAVISHCRFMVAARTHASIAAYSTQVPTLVVGYSVKARGIANDIFGTSEHYVIPVQSLRRPNELADEFRWLLAHEMEIREHYADFMPNYLMKAFEAGAMLKSI